MRWSEEQYADFLKRRGSAKPRRKVDVSNPPFALPTDRELITNVLDLPVPPSVNQSRRIDWKGRARHKKWIGRAEMMLMAARGRTESPLRKIMGRFEVRVVLSEAHTRIDADNGLKALIDFLRHADLIVDDSQKYMRRLVVEWGMAPTGCRVTLVELA